MLNFKSFMNENSMEWGDIENIHTILEDICLEILAENGLIENLDDSLIRKLSKKIKPAKKTFWADEKIKDFTGKNDKEKVVALYKKYEPIIEDRLKKYESGLKTALKGVQNAKIMVDIKKLRAFVNKTVDRGKDPSKMNDWLRGSILVNDEKDIGIVSKNIFKAFKSVSEFDPKERGDDKQFGYYGSVHFSVDVDGVNTEIQLMTKKLYSAKKVAGGQYDDFRSASDAIKGSKETQKLLRHGKRAFDKGNSQGGGAGVNVDKQKSKYVKVSGLTSTDRQTRRYLKPKKSERSKDRG
tara:strand:- start:2741 stop:3628 length:888 start_codon:yes stop_codon:yes gene_type:complete